MNTTNKINKGYSKIELMSTKSPVLRYTATKVRKEGTKDVFELKSQWLYEDNKEDNTRTPMQNKVVAYEKFEEHTLGTLISKLDDYDKLFGTDFAYQVRHKFGEA